MISYELYKVLHLTAIFLFLTASSILLVLGKREKIWIILTGVATLLVLVTGMALVHLGEFGMKPWVIGLIVIWFLISGLGHMIAKRFPQKGKQAYWFMLTLAIMATILAVYKP